MVLKDELVTNLSDGNRQGEQAVIICLQFPVGKLQEKKALDALFDLDDIFCSVIETSGIGTYDGHELFEGPEEESVRFFIYGPDANRIYEEVKPILQLLPRLQEVSIVKQYAEVEAYDRRANLS